MGSVGGQRVKVGTRHAPQLTPPYPNALQARLGTRVARSDHACEVILTSNTHHQGQHARYTGLFEGAFDGKS